MLARKARVLLRRASRSFSAATTGLPLEGRVVIVTGAARGLGAGIARSVMEDGADVVLVDRERPPLFEPSEFTFDTDAPPPADGDGGRAVEWVEGDVSEESTVRAAEAAAERLLLRPSAGVTRSISLASCAGIDHRGHLATISRDDVTGVLGVNVGAMLQFAQATLRLHRRVVARGRASGSALFRPGRDPSPTEAFDEPARPAGPRDVGPCTAAVAASIVLVSSVQATASMGHATLYAASKAALTGMISSGAVELAGEGVRINGVVPTVSGTRNVWASICREHGSEAAALGKWGPNLPLGRPVAPEEVGDVVSFLLSPRASGVTGSLLSVDAGNLAQLVSTDAANT